jgi:dTDP-4-amino-4,6-dideoxygalactose transaminase
MLTTSDAELATRARRLREHGMSISAADRHASRQPVIESYLEVGFNYRMTDIQAAVGLVQLAKLDAMVQRRRELAARYQEMLADVPGLRTVQDPAWGESNFQSFWVELDRDYPLSRNELLSALAADGISARAGIMAAHRQPAYDGHLHVDLPVTERLTDNTLILPLFHTLGEDDQAAVVGAIRRAAGLESRSMTFAGSPAASRA